MECSTAQLGSSGEYFSNSTDNWLMIGAAASSSNGVCPDIVSDIYNHSVGLQEICAQNALILHFYDYECVNHMEIVHPHGNVSHAENVETFSAYPASSQRTFSDRSNNKSLFTSDTVAPVSMRQRCRRSPNVALMKTAVGETLLIGMALALWADPWPNSGSALGHFPVSADVGLGNDIDSLEQNVLVGHKRSNSSHFGVAYGHFVF